MLHGKGPLFSFSVSLFRFVPAHTIRWLDSLMVSPCHCLPLFELRFRKLICVIIKFENRTQLEDGGNDEGKG